MPAVIERNRLNGHADEPKPNGKAKKSAEPKGTEVVIAPPNFQTAELTIVGTSPYVQNKFSQKAKEMMKAKQEAGGQGKKGGKREPKDFKQCYEDAKYISRKGWVGIPAASFRAAMVSACRTVGFKMTHAKLGFMVVADGFTGDEGVPLVQFTKGEPHYFEQAVRNESGVADIRARPMWNEGWEAVIRIRFDADMFSLSDIANLLHRAGEQVGIGEGRPDSRKCVGLGWGTFSIKGK